MSQKEQQIIDLQMQWNRCDLSPVSATRIIDALVGQALSLVSEVATLEAEIVNLREEMGEMAPFADEEGDG